MIRCPGCQHELPLGIRRCPFCDHQLSEASKGLEALEGLRAKLSGLRKDLRTVAVSSPRPDIGVVDVPVEAGSGEEVADLAYRVRVETGGRAGEEFEIGRIITFGRSENCEVELHDIDVSREHCRIVYHPDRRVFLVQDLGSQNGTYLNGAPVRQAELRTGDRIGVGRAEVVFLSADELGVSLSLGESEPSGSHDPYEDPPEPEARTLSDSDASVDQDEQEPAVQPGDLEAPISEIEDVIIFDGDDTPVSVDEVAERAPSPEAPRPFEPSSTFSDGEDVAPVDTGLNVEQPTESPERTLETSELGSSPDAAGPVDAALDVDGGPKTDHAVATRPQRAASVGSDVEVDADPEFATSAAPDVESDLDPELASAAVPDVEVASESDVDVANEPGADVIVEEHTEPNIQVAGFSKGPAYVDTSTATEHEGARAAYWFVVGAFFLGGLGMALVWIFWDR